MTADLVLRLKSRFGAESRQLTPNRAIKIIRSTSSLNSIDPNDLAEQVLSNLLPEVEDKLVSDLKREKFKKRIEVLLDEYTTSQLAKMDAECLKDDGRIDTIRLDEILYEI